MTWLRRNLVGRVLLWMVATAPIIILLMMALSRQWRFPDILPASFGLETIETLLLGTRGVVDSLMLSLAIAIAVAVLATGAGLIASRFVAHSRHRGRWLLAIYAPFASAPVLIGIALMVFFYAMRLDGQVLGIIFAQLIFATAFAIILLEPFWNARTQAMEAQAATLGASGLAIARHVLLPMAVPMLRLCMVQCFLFSWFQYGLVLLLGGGRVVTLPLQVYGFINEANPHYAAVASLLLVAPPLAMLLINRRLLTGVPGQ